MKKTYFSFLLFLSCTLLFAQDENKVYKDTVYVDYIRSVQLSIPGFMTSQPIINLGSGQLKLSFDDLDGDAREFIYSVEHCNADWTPSDLSEMEFLDGFNEEEIETYDFSFNTLQEYTNYQVRIPNDDFKITKSGNYLLKVYDNEDEKTLVFTRRFMIVDPRFLVSADVLLPRMVKRNKTHQEIDFTVTHKGIRVANPRQEIKVVVMQNGRWDNAIQDIKPQFIKGETLQYFLMNKVVFPAGKEFRYVDLRSLRFRSEKVKAIEEYEDSYDVTLYTDKDRNFLAYHFLRDLNGGFVLGNIDGDYNSNITFFDNDNDDVRQAKLDLLRRQMSENERDNSLESDYANVLFSLHKDQEVYNHDVYLFGAMTDWQIKEEFKMNYVDKAQAYAADVNLKQGFYNYLYAAVPKKGPKVVDLEMLEGNWFETENQYTILVYYKAFGERYDHLVAAYTFDSLRR